jgi:hypothetical protein
VADYLKLVARTRGPSGRADRSLVSLLQKSHWTAGDFWLEERFVAVVRIVARRRGLRREVWREFGVEAHILDRANLHSM